jgi:Protein of unknown function, DUF488
MIFTCNFANWTKIPVPVEPISICNFPPKGWAGKEYPQLFPTVDMLNAFKTCAINEVTFNEEYANQILKRLSPHKVVEDLYEMAGDKPAVVLLCYESSSKFCHRHLVRSWLKHYKFSINEYYVQPVLKNSLGLRRKRD